MKTRGDSKHPEHVSETAERKPFPAKSDEEDSHERRAMEGKERQTFFQREPFRGCWMQVEWGFGGDGSGWGLGVDRHARHSE